MLVSTMARLDGLRVLSFESRRAKEIAQLVTNQGGIPILAPATREVATGPDAAELELIRGIRKREFDAVIFMTGVGAKAVVEIAETVYPRQEFISSLAEIQVVVRGPKPAAVMRDLNVPIALHVPEPNTWREIVSALDANPDKVPLAGRRVAVQEHGSPSTELYAELRQRGAQVFPVRVYRWELPEDTAPLRNAIAALVADEVDIVLFTSRVQFQHAEQVAEQMGLGVEFKQALNRVAVASIGPVATQALRQDGIRVDFEPSHPKMGYLVREAAEKLAPLVRPRTTPRS
jgi:uroporphyrinogen-III synthase